MVLMCNTHEHKSFSDPTSAHTVPVWSSMACYHQRGSTKAMGVHGYIHNLWCDLRR